MWLPLSLKNVCSSDNTRYAINNIYIDVEDKLAIATDGHILMAVPFTIEEDEECESGYLSVEALQAAHKDKVRKGYFTHRKTETVTVSGVTYPNPDDGMFPDWRKVLPNATLHCEQSWCAFDSMLLCRIAAVFEEILLKDCSKRARSFYTHAVKLLFHKDSNTNYPITVLPAYYAIEGIIAVIMPYIVKG